MWNPTLLSREAPRSEAHSLVTGALSVISRIALTLGIETMNSDLGEFGALLCTIGLSTEKDKLVETKLEHILEHVERACTYPRHQVSRDFPTLKKIVAAKASQGATSIQFTSLSTKSEKDIKASLQRYVSQSPEFRILLRLLEEFPAENESGSTNYAPSETIEHKEIVPEYPSHVNKLLYRALCPHLCSCSCNTGKPHEARLRLKPQEDREGDYFLRFEMLFSAPTTTFCQRPTVEWQESKILIPRNDPSKNRRKPRKNVSFLDKAFDEPHVHHEHSEKIDPGGFCKLLGLRGASVLSFTIDFQMLRSLHSHEVPQRKVQPKDSLSLFDVLKTRSMSRRAKCILAYTLAKSVWQYYGSGWMNAPWTHHDIHLLEDQDFKLQTSTRGTLSCRPYLVATFHGQHSDFPEYYDVENAMHQYPQVLALGILLIEIARGQPLASAEMDGQSIGYDYAGINHYFTSAWSSLHDLGEIDFETYKESVNRCLDLDLFAEAPFISGPGQNLDNELQVRRDILYRRVVSPLKKLLEGSGWLSDLDAIKQELISQTTTRTRIPTLDMRIPSNKESHSSLLTEEAKTALDTVEDGQRAQLLGRRVKSAPESTWLKKIDSINLRLKAMCGKSPLSGTEPIRIAVLDTGCNLKDLEAIFTVSDQEKHIRENWMDWAGNSMEPEDDHGHGTAIAAVLLRTARDAEIYVGRVGKNPKSLQDSGDNIAKAIIHAAAVWDVDLVSLSFGFSSEIDSVRNAIRKAEIIKNDSIVFFAAAANEGANSYEMFPAYLDSVISMRGTEASGGFVPDLNPPSVRMNSESHLFGTLGKDVPWDWPDENPARRMTGCSIAAPLAAGIAALILQYTASRPELDEKKQRLIKSRRGVVQVFRKISVNQGNGRYYIAPWHFFTDQQEDWLTVLLDVVRDLPRSL